MLPPLKRRLLHIALACAPLVMTSPGSAQPAMEPIVGDTARPFRATVAQDTLWDIAGKVAGQAGVSRQQVMVAILRRNPEAFVKGNIHRLRQGASLMLPTVAQLRAEDRAAAAALLEAHLKAMRSGEALPPLPVSAELSVALAASAPVMAASVPQRSASAVESPKPGVSAPVQASAPAVVAAAPERVASVAEPVQEAAPASASITPLRPAADAASESAPSGELGWWPWALLGGALLAGTVVWRRQARGPGAGADGVPRAAEDARAAPAPRNFDVSTAAVDMARTVEAAPLVTELVRAVESAAPVPEGEEPSGVVVPGASGDGDDPEVRGALRVEMARTCLEIGRDADARALLEAVLREDAVRHQAAASEILARMG
jgi:FimV-like protein